FESICNKEKKKKIKLIAARRNMPVSDTSQKEAIWMVWELLLYESKKKSNGIHEIVKSLLNLYCVRFKHSSIRKRKTIIYNAIFLITENINSNIAIYNETDKNIIHNVKEKINIIYKQIKKNEVKPQTDYLFNNSINKNLEKTISKLDKMAKLNMIIRN
ncbi:MAG: hypothetical protein H8E55_05810, partial [Pelagibacterales bacterium]|nr:hypothetical protein [Pelagibacterales bacterium]